MYVGMGVQRATPDLLHDVYSVAVGEGSTAMDGVSLCELFWDLLERGSTPVGSFKGNNSQL